MTLGRRKIENEEEEAMKKMRRKRRKERKRIYHRVGRLYK